MLQAMDIRKRFGGLDVLRGVSVQVSRGEVVAIIGRSGSGKSTLLRCLTHLETIDSGEIRIGGEPMVTTDASGAARYRRERELRPLCLKMGMVFQDYNLFPHYTVLRNLVMPQKLVLHRSAQEAEKRRARCLRRWGWPTRPTNTRATSPAGSASAWPSPGRCAWIPRSSASTSRPPRSIRS